MKTVLISIKPQWCELIVIGKKLLEVRKTRPKLKTPFKCYIYQTKKKWWYKLLEPLKSFAWAEALRTGRGKVIGEFVCDAILPISVKYSDPNSPVAQKEFPGTCLSDKQIIDYLGNGVTGYGWHISDLKIYDKPKALSAFCFPPERFCEPGLCGGCPKYEMPDEYGDVMFDCEWKRPIMHPPQSWCYVEEV